MAGFYVQIKGLEDAQKLLSGIKDGSRKAIARALNKTVGTSSGGVQSDAVKEVAKEFNLTQKDIKRDFKIKKATYTDLSAYVRAQGRPVPLERFIRTRQTQKGVSIQVKKNRSRVVIPHLFIRKYKGGVFIRLALIRDITSNPMSIRRDKSGKFLGKFRDKRFPIKHRFGPRIPDIFSNAEVMEPILKKAQERLDKNFGHEVEFLLESGK